MTSVPVQLTAEQRLARGLELARALAERARLLDEHADRKRFMAQELKRLDRQIAQLADVVRTGIDYEPMQISFLPREREEDER